MNIFINPKIPLNRSVYDSLLTGQFLQDSATSPIDVVLLARHLTGRALNLTSSLFDLAGTSIVSRRWQTYNNNNQIPGGRSKRFVTAMDQLRIRDISLTLLSIKVKVCKHYGAGIPHFAGDCS